MDRLNEIFNKSCELYTQFLTSGRTLLEKANYIRELTELYESASAVKASTDEEFTTLCNIKNSIRAKLSEVLK